MTHWDRIVVGAGIAGLLAAWRAVGRGESVLVLERAARAGGVVTGLEVDGVVVDAGAESFSTTGDACIRLIAELGLSAHVVSPHRSDAHIVSAGGDRYRIPHGVLGIPSTLDDPELGAIISAEGMELARHRDAAPPGDVAQLSVAELVASRLGAEFVDRLVDPLVSGVHGSSARSLGAHATIPEVLAKLHDTGSLCAAVAAVRAAQPRPGSAVAGLNGGLFQIADRLVEMLSRAGVAFRYGQEVQSLSPTAPGWLCHTAAGDHVAAAVTVSTGATPDRRLVRTVSGTQETGRGASGVDAALVFASVDSERLASYPLGSGALVAVGAGVTAKATTHINAKWGWVQERLAPNRHLIRLSYGRDGLIPQGNLVALARDDLSRLYGVTASEVIGATVVRWSGALARLSAPAAQPPRERQSPSASGEPELCGSFVSGNGLRAIVSDHYQRTTE